MSNIFTIPAGVSFARSLAQRILREMAVEDLPAQVILLPTRRAVRVLREAFLAEADGQALLLPRMQSIGDVDEEELFLASVGDFEILPPLAPMKRRFLLAKLILAREDFAGGMDQAMALAGALGTLMDHIYTENLDLADLAGLVPDSFADHWQITLDFLKILSEHWPAILEEMGVIDAADRRNRLILALAQFWRDVPPDIPIIVAGSTGSIPATRDLMNVVAGLPQGRIVLPDLDRELDEASWGALEAHHPQYLLRQVLVDMGVERSEVLDWDDFEVTARRGLARDIMRPANYFGVGDQGYDVSDLSLVTCGHVQEEAEAIALCMRGVLEEVDKRAVLITPDRDLAARVSRAVERWGVRVDDSAGVPLSATPVGRFILLTAEAVAEDFSPVALMALVKHPFFDLVSGDVVEAMDLALRGPKPSDVFGFLEEAGVDVLALREAFDGFSKDELDMSRVIEGHLRVIDSVSSVENVWAGAEGEAAAAFFGEVMDYAALAGAVDVRIYIRVLELLMSGIVVRPSFGTHPRLQILGQLEARMVDADVVIMGGLNEGVWPPDPGHDPWMSRFMRESFGLPASEQSIGLAAHDFVQAFCGVKVVMTRAARRDGTPTIPARWLQRLETVLKGASVSLADDPLVDWVRGMDRADEYEPVSRPAPTPPVSARPKRVSVTRVEQWLGDPYGIYARYVLDVTALQPLEMNADAALRGTVLHDILQRFVADRVFESSSGDSDVMMEALRAIGREEIERTIQDASMIQFWMPRLDRVFHWMIQHEQGWRGQWTPAAVEERGSMEIADIVIDGIVDRIDVSRDGEISIMDYKTGGMFSKKALADGRLPQLPLEALIAQVGGFKGVDVRDVGSLKYLVMTGGREAGKVVELDKDVADVLERTHMGLEELIYSFMDEATPYLCLPDPQNAPRFNDYEHLGRVGEWGVSGEDDEVAA